MNTFKRISLAVLALVVVCGAIAGAATIATRRQAEAFLSELRSTQLGAGGYERVKKIATRFRKGVAESGGTCSPSECSLTVSFENTCLRRLHLATWTKFGGTLLVRNGQLYHISTGMTLYTRERVIGAETILSEQSEGGSPQFRVITKRWTDNQPWQAVVQLTPQATSSERETAFAFNLSCLDKLGGCKDSSDLLPSVWRETNSMASSNDQ
jgi:hypothetical protein